MSETKFTKGPWKRKDNFVYSPMFNEDDTLFVSIAVACTGIAPAIANANLIAAAPDMYEALETTCEYCIGKEATDCPCERCITGKALRKARGEDGNDGYCGLTGKEVS